ncbi:hypothetical protein D3C76_1256060 [compost metagenome]
MTYIEGCTAEEYQQEEGDKSLGYILGEGLRTIHNVPIDNCFFNDFLPEKLIDMVKNNINERKHEVIEAINNSFPNQNLPLEANLVVIASKGRFYYEVK